MHNLVGGQLQNFRVWAYARLNLYLLLYCLGSSPLASLHTPLHKSSRRSFFSFPAWTSSVYFFFSTALCQPSGMLIDRFGPRIIAATGGLLFGVGCIAASFTPSIITFIIPYGLLGGLGYAFLYPSSIVIVANHWRRRGYGPVANGITTSGMGVGTAAFGPISYALIKRFQWRWYLRVVGFFFFGTSALTLIVYRELKKEENVQQKRRFFDRSLLKNLAFVFYLIGTIVIYLGVTVPIVHMVSSDDVYGTLINVLFSGFRFAMPSICALVNWTLIISSSIWALVPQSVV